MAITHAISPAPRHEWNELVLADRDAVTEQTPVWMDALAAAGGFRDASRLYRFGDGRRFVLPLVRRSGYGPRTGFGTGWGIGGIVGADLDSSAVTSIVADLREDRAVYSHVRPNPLQQRAWSEANTVPAKPITRRAHLVDLGGGIDETHDRFRRSGQRGVRLAERAGVEVTTHLAGEALDQYYERLYLPSIQRWAARQHEPLALARVRATRRDPLAKLQKIAATLGDSFRLYLGWVEGELAVGNVVVAGPHNSHATRGAMNYDLAGKSRASYAADWAAIRDACAAGHRWYQMGESGENQSLAAYKERFGATAVDYNEYRVERLPLLEIDAGLRTAAKKLIGFRDA